MTSRICIVTEAMKAYASFCEKVPEQRPYIPRGVDHVPIIIATTKSDARGFTAWFESYRKSHTNEWWKLKSGEEISRMLHDLLITEEAWHEVSELVQCIQLTPPADSPNDA